MINSSPETAIKNIFERAANSLSYKRDQLDKTRQILKKAVLRLSSSINSDDSQVNNVLHEIKSSVDVNFNISDLNSQIDKLSILTNNSCTKLNSNKSKEFYSRLNNSLSELDCSEECAKHIRSFADRKLSDKDLSLEILKLLNQYSNSK